MRKTIMYSIGNIALMLTACVQSQISTDDQKPISGDFHYIDGYAPLSDNNNIQVVIEIPTGTTQKWEVSKSDGKLHWELKNGKPRIIKYLGYPGNYGMVPRTLLSQESGGDGDPLDVLVLGPPIERGRVINAKLIGLLKLLDGGEQDDKLIAVIEGAAFYNVTSIEDLELNFPGVMSIIETWFESYKGPGELISSGFTGVDEANSLLTKAIETYEHRDN